MARTSRYTIDETKKTIYADILALTEKETEALTKFKRLGYEIVNRESEKSKRLDDAYIEAYLNTFDETAIETYKGEKQKKTFSKGKTRDKGFNAGRNWFARTYPKGDIKEIESKIKAAGLTETMNDTYKKYEDKNGNEKMSKEEYTRYFYWTKVFNRDIEDTMIFTSAKTVE